ncbi:MAG TPA: hypothetical protein VIR02_01315 [Anaerolineales bacterium]
MESRILQLIAALRASGVRVSLAESAEAFSAVDLMGIQHREHFRLSLRTTLIKDVRDLPVFDKLFPLFFGNGEQPMMGGNPTDDMTPLDFGLPSNARRACCSSEILPGMARMGREDRVISVRIWEASDLIPVDGGWEILTTIRSVRAQRSRIF